jgi:hypothetical protein
MFTTFFLGAVYKKVARKYGRAGEIIGDNMA